jgi:hypothetical protein
MVRKFGLSSLGVFAVMWLAPTGDAVAQEGMNPCAAKQAAMIRQGDHELDTHGKSWDDLAAMGAKLWNDKSLSGGGATSCATCHQNGTGMMNASFSKPYPHAVKMASDKFGLDEVTAAEMVQMCMLVPMNAKPLDWKSVELAALTAQVKHLQMGYKAGAMNPCAANPCGAGAMNPCAANPCGAGAMNPCAANPCGAGAMNTCAANPCGAGTN